MQNTQQPTLPGQATARQICQICQIHKGAPHGRLGNRKLAAYTVHAQAPTTQTGQWSTDLATWTDVTPVLVNENAALADDMTITVPNANAVAGKLFLRLNAVK